MRTENQRTAALVLLLLVVLLGAACRQDMHDQAKYEPLEASAFYLDGTSARLQPAHTVARGDLREDRELYTGFRADRTYVEELPVELDRQLLERGRERFGIYCTPCHDYTGSGRGMIVQRGLKEPPSYHQERLRQMPIGYFYDVISNGYATMPSYAAQVKPRDRWAIAAYIRVLQKSQGTPFESLPTSDQEQVSAGNAGQEQAGDAAHAAGGGR